jgi:hypothetical protein
MCGWVQRGDRARLALKAFAEGRVAADVRRQDLDRNDPIEARIVRFCRPRPSRLHRGRIGSRTAQGEYRDRGAWIVVSGVGF